MSLNIKTTNDSEMIDIVSSSINRELIKGRRVLWFVTGGSSISIQALISKNIDEKFSNNLVITLTDERYGPLNHSESNWTKLIDLGFKVNGAKLIPFLSGKSFIETKEEINNILEIELEKAEYKIGIFGIGSDSHTAGILPHSLAVESKENLCAYETPLFDRITITPRVISSFNEAFVFVFGEAKWPAIAKLENDGSIDEEPAQILKKIPLLTIFTDYKK